MADIRKGFSCLGTASSDRFALVGGDYYLLIIGQNAEQRNSKNFLYIIHRHHFTAFYHIRPDTIDDKRNIPQILRLQKADDAVRVPDGRNLRRSHNNCLIGTGNCICKSLLNACRTVKKNKIKALF